MQTHADTGTHAQTHRKVKKMPLTHKWVKALKKKTSLVQFVAVDNEQIISDPII